MHFAIEFAVIVVSGAYTSLWGAFKDGPYEGFKPKTFPRSVYFHIAIFLPLYFLPIFSAHVGHLGLIQLFFLVMGIERFLTGIYKGFFRTEDQSKYFVPSRITFFGRYVESDLLRYGVGTVIVAIVFAFLLVDLPITGFWSYLAVAYATGCIVALSGAYKDAPFEGFKPLKFQRSGTVLAVLSPIFYSLSRPGKPAATGFSHLYERRPEALFRRVLQDLHTAQYVGQVPPRPTPHIQEQLDTRERFHYAALAIIAALALLYAHELGVL